MNIESMILYVVYSCTFLSLAFIPNKYLKGASMIFLYQQFVTWFLGLLVVELRLIEYPVRELADVNRTSFLFEFLFFPIVSIFFCIFYPEACSTIRKFLYIFTYCTVLTVSEVIIETYTHLINYTNWEWYFTWLTVYATLYLSWLFYKWFFRIEKIDTKVKI